MPRATELLHRFRLAGAPGAAAPGGVPADRPAEAAAEVGPVLALLDPAQAAARQVREQAEAEAATTRRRAHEDGARRVAAARARAEGWARRAAEEAAREAGEQADATRRAGEAQAAAVREHADRVLPRHVERVVATVLTLAGGAS